MNICDIVDPSKDELWVPGIWGIAIGCVATAFSCIVVFFQCLRSKIKLSKYLFRFLLIIQTILFAIHYVNYNAYNEWYEKNKLWLEENCDNSTNFAYAIKNNLTISYTPDPDDKALMSDLRYGLGVFIVYDLLYILYQYRFSVLRRNFKVI